MSGGVYTCALEDVLKLAKCSFKPMTCEWQNCSGPSVLNSWKTFEQHLIQHCLTADNSELVTYSCQYQSCSARIHTSQAELLAHVLSSHLARIQLLCPIDGCQWTFNRIAQLKGHLEGEHSKHFDAETSLLQVQPGFLKQSCRPYKPPAPPALQPLIQGRYSVQEVLPFPINTGQLKSSLSRSTALADLCQTSHPRYNVWGYLNNLGPEEELEKRMEGYEPPLPLHIKVIHAAELTDAGATLVVRHKPLEYEFDPVHQLLSRPVPIPIPNTPIILKPPPRTIGFEIHKRTALISAGLESVSESESPPPENTGVRRSREESVSESSDMSRISKRAR